MYLCSKEVFVVSNFFCLSILSLDIIIFFNFLLILSKFLLLDLLLSLLSLPLRLIEFDKFFLSLTSPIVK